MAEANWFTRLRSALQTVGAARVAWDLFQSALPWLLAGGVGVPAWLDPNIPWYFALLAFGVTGAAFSSWKNQGRNNRIFGTPEYKVVAMRGFLLRLKGRPENFQLIIEVHNRSDFLVEVNLKRTFCEINGNAGSQISPVLNKKTLLYPRTNANMVLREYPISVSNEPHNGRMYISYDYGEPNKKVFSFESYVQFAFSRMEETVNQIEIVGNAVEPFDLE